MKFYLSYHPNVNQCLSTFGGNFSIDGAAIKHFLDFLECAKLGFYLMKSHKNIYTRCILLENTMIQFLCTYLTRGRCNSAFYKILLIIISQLLLNGIAQNFRWNICTTRDDIDIISVVLPHQGALQFYFFKNSFDSHISASVAWNCSKFFVEYTHSQCFSQTFLGGRCTLPNFLLPKMHPAESSAAKNVLCLFFCG